MFVRNPQHNNNIFFAEIFDTDIKKGLLEILSMESFFFNLCVACYFSTTSFLMAVFPFSSVKCKM